MQKTKQYWHDPDWQYWHTWCCTRLWAVAVLVKIEPCLMPVPVPVPVINGGCPTGVPLVFEAKSWEHGVMIGACVKSETTAAAEFKGGYLSLSVSFSLSLSPLLTISLPKPCLSPPPTPTSLCPLVFQYKCWTCVTQGVLTDASIQVWWRCVSTRCWLVCQYKMLPGGSVQGVLLGVSVQGVDWCASTRCWLVCQYKSVVWCVSTRCWLVCCYKSVAWCVSTRCVAWGVSTRCVVLCWYRQEDHAWSDGNATLHGLQLRPLPTALVGPCQGAWQKGMVQKALGRSERVRSAWLCQNMTSFLCNSILPPEMEMKERISTRVVVVVVVARPNSLPALVHVPQA